MAHIIIIKLLYILENKLKKYDKVHFDSGKESSLAMKHIDILKAHK